MVVVVVVVAAAADCDAVDQICADLKRLRQKLLIEVCPGLEYLCGRPVGDKSENMGYFERFLFKSEREILQVMYVQGDNF